mmetsp:Transcript_27372/g.93431  ORF Transcript_27372/g.93431 Transcript_27372/m.93431 type:complete len:248 (+) Transcript_27372:883-1626(+)
MTVWKFDPARNAGPPGPSGRSRRVRRPSGRGAPPPPPSSPREPFPPVTGGPGASSTPCWVRQYRTGLGCALSPSASSRGGERSDFTVRPMGCSLRQPCALRKLAIELRASSLLCHMSARPSPSASTAHLRYAVGMNWHCPMAPAHEPFTSPTLQCPASRTCISSTSSRRKYRERASSPPALCASSARDWATSNVPIMAPKLLSTPHSATRTAAGTPYSASILDSSCPCSSRSPAPASTRSALTTPSM